MTPLPQGSVDLGGLLARIGAEFPDLEFTHAVLNDEGEDHAVVILDDAWVFRFPRTAERLALFQAELKLLQSIRAASPIPVPNYMRIGPDAAFGGYPMIKGAALTPKTFAALNRRAQDRILGEVAALLRLVHSTPPAVIANADGEVTRNWTGADYAHRYDQDTRTRIGGLVSPSLLTAIDGFYAAYAQAPQSPAQVVVHGDLTDDHMLLAQGRESLAGVIDFADAALGDPAFDFSFFWIYGEGAAEFLARSYGGADAGLLERSRWSFARYRIDQTCWAREGHIPQHHAPTEDELTRLLQSLRIPSPLAGEGFC